MRLTDRINSLFDDNPDLKNTTVADALKVTRTTLTDWRSGKTKELTPENGFALAEYFGVSPKWLMLGVGKKCLQPKDSEREIKAVTDNEIKSILLIRRMADFQQLEWLAEGEEKARLYERFKNSLQK